MFRKKLFYFIQLLLYLIGLSIPPPPPPRCLGLEHDGTHVMQGRGRMVVDPRISSMPRQLGRGGGGVTTKRKCDLSLWFPTSSRLLCMSPRLVDPQLLREPPSHGDNVDFFCIASGWPPELYRGEVRPLPPAGVCAERALQFSVGEPRQAARAAVRQSEDEGAAELPRLVRR